LKLPNILHSGNTC